MVHFVQSGLQDHFWFEIWKLQADGIFRVWPLQPFQGHGMVMFTQTHKVLGNCHYKHQCSQLQYCFHIFWSLRRSKALYTQYKNTVLAEKRLGYITEWKIPFLLITHSDTMDVSEFKEELNHNRRILSPDHALHIGMEMMLVTQTTNNSHPTYFRSKSLKFPRENSAQVSMALS